MFIPSCIISLSCLHLLILNTFRAIDVHKRVYRKQTTEQSPHLEDYSTCFGYFLWLLIQRIYIYISFVH